MLHLTDTAKKQLRALLRGKRGNRRFFRLVYSGSPYVEFVPVAPEACHPSAPRVRITRKGIFGDKTDFTVILDPAQTETLEGASVHFLIQANGPGAFEIFLAKELPLQAPPPLLSSPKAHSIQELLDQEINPAIAGHGGFAQLIEVRDDVVFLKMGGGCQGCAASALTLKQGIETRIKQAFPEIREVIDQTDHAAGTQPFFRP